MATFRTWLVGALVACMAIGGSAVGARAQSCGDPNGDGLNVVDAANVLRAAVSLPSTCNTVPALCDVDGTGTITVIDSANVLRRAVGLPGANACTVASQQVSDVLTEVAPLLTIGIAQIPIPTAQAATTVPCDQGFIEILDDQVSFSGCVFGTLALNGSLSVDGTQVAFSLSINDLVSGSFIDADGTLEAFNDVDFGPIAEGTLTVNSSDLGGIAIVFTAVSLNFAPATGTPIFGTIVITPSDVPGVDTITQLLNADNAVRVIVDFDDGSEQQFLFDPNNGTLVGVEPAVCPFCAGPNDPPCTAETQPFCDETCTCLHTTAGQCFCHQGEAGNCGVIETMPCTSDSACPPNFKCAQSCCGVTGQAFCHPPCGTFLGTAGAAAAGNGQSGPLRPH